MELTAQQIADGWIAHDGHGLPSGLRENQSVEVMLRSGEVRRGYFDTELSIYSWAGTPEHGLDRVAWRLPHVEGSDAPQAATVADPNAAMLAADERPAYDVKAMAGNGCIFGTPRAEKCNLLTVAPISATGFSVWGCHD